ncbi:hypothetical protein Tco_1376474 [Tanacetum coccineum]
MPLFGSHAINNNKAFSSPPTQDTLINFVNDLGYPKEVKQLSNVVTNDMFQPWRALTTIINFPYGERLQHKFHPRPESPLHLPTKEPILGYLKFSAKGQKEVPKLNDYLACEEVSDPDSPIPKPTKLTNPKVTKQAKPVAPKAATKKPQPAPTKPKEKKQKQAKESTEATPPAKRAKARKVVKKRTLKRSQQLVDEFVDEGIPLTEPGFGDLEADTQKAIKESLKDAHGAPRGPLPPVVFRETGTGKFQPLPEVEGKGKEKVSVEQAAQRRTSEPTKPSGHDESSSLYVELGLTESDVESDEEMPSVVKSGDQDAGQAGLDPGIQDKGQAEPNPDNVAESQPLSTPGENLKLTVEEQVILEEPASSTWTLSSLQHLTKDFSFGDHFFNDKPSKAENEKTTAETEAKSMVSVTIHPDTSVIPPMTSPVIDLISRPNSPNEHQPIPATATATTTTTTTTHPLPPQP